MKKIYRLLCTLLFALLLAVPALAGEFYPALTIDRSVPGQISVTVEQSDVLSQKTPTLTIRCDFAEAYVRRGGGIVSSSLDTAAQTIRFTVASGGTYTIVSGTAPVQPAPSAGAKTLDVTVSGGSESAGVQVGLGDAEASVKAPEKKELSAIAEASKAADLPVKIDLSALDDSITAAVLPEQVVSAVSAAETGLSVSMPGGITASFDAAAVKTLASAGSGDVKLVIADVPQSSLSEEQRALVGDNPVLELSAFSGTTQVHEFGGNVTVGVPVTGSPKDGMIVWRMTRTADERVTLEPISVKYNAATNCYEFQTPRFSEYVLAYFPFADIPADAWYYEDAAYSYAGGLLSGTGKTSFSPEDTMTRAMLVTVLWRMEGKPAAAGSPFSDVKPDAYFAEAAAWAAENKIAEGYGGGKFGPNDPVTRQQLAAILWRYAGYKGYDLTAAADLSGFADGQAAAPYALPALRWACGEGLLRGSGGRLLPEGPASRAQAAAILHRFCELTAK